MKRIALAVFLAVSVSRPLCGAELRVWQMTLRPRTAEEIAQRFARLHPGVRVSVETLSWDDALQKIVLAIASHREPDVLELGSTWIPQFRSAGALAILPRQLADGLLLTAPGRTGSAVDAVPWFLGTRALFVNRSMLRAAGLSRPPARTDELLADCVSLERLFGSGRCIGLAAADAYAPWQQLLSFAWSRNPDFLGEAIDVDDIHRPELLEAARLYQALRPHAMADLPRVIDSQFVAGRLPMVISGLWLALVARDAAPDLDYEVVPIPALPGGVPRAFAGGEYLAVSSHSSQPKLAQSFIRFLLEPEVIGEIVGSQPGLLSARGGVEPPPASATVPARLLAARQSFQSMLGSAVAPPADLHWAEAEQPLSSIVDDILLAGDAPGPALLKGKETLRSALRAKAAGRTGSAEAIIGVVEWIGIAGALLILLPRRRISFFKRIPMAVWSLQFLVVYALPALFVAVISCTSYDLLTARIAWVGRSNYAALFHSDRLRHAVAVTLAFVSMSVPLTMFLALAAAYAFQRLRRLRTAAEVGVYLPPVLPVVVTATLFGALFIAGGPAEWLVHVSGLPAPKPSWLLNPGAAMAVVVLHAAWSSFGYYAIFFAAALSTIPMSVRDAAAIDGAGAWLRFRSLEWPVLRPTVILVAVLHVVRSLQVFPEILILTHGGPSGATTTVVYELYEVAFRSFDFGAASAIAVVLMTVTVAASIPFVARSAAAR
jgi:ABC-type sugar transport system permease subunit/ABC-type glycerol-3-phosphate transport system substrate-binding protein